MISKFLHLGSAALSFCLLAGIAASTAVRADDIDVYANPPANTVSPPATIIVLDLNLIGVCDNPLTDAGGTPVYGTLNPLGAPACVYLRTETLQTYLQQVGADPTTILTTALTALGPAGLCAVYSQLGIGSPGVPSGILGIGTLGCSTLAALGSVIPGTVTTFTNALIAGLTNPLLSTVLSQLPSAVQNAVSTALSNAGIPALLIDPTSITTLGQVLGNILNNLINSRVAIVVSHANRASPSGTQPTDPYVCSFADRASIPSARQATVGCSNGGFFFIGFTPLTDATTVAALQARINNLLAPLLPPNPFTAAGAAAYLARVQSYLKGTIPGSANLTPMFQEKENYDEIVHYLTADALYNGALNSYDGLFTALPRDSSIESGTVPSASYVNPKLPCRTINVINIQASNDTGESDSDTDLARYFPTTTLTVSGSQTQGFANLVAAAQNPGFIDSAGNRYILNSYFLIQNTLSSLSALSNAGATVLTYADALGLVGLGASSPTFQPLVTDASLVSATSTTDRLATDQVLGPAFFAEFRAAINQQPRWSGNVKRLDLKKDPTTGLYSYIDQSGGTAIDTDGRIKTTALTIWTDKSKLGGAAVDGRMTTLGGAGQNIPGYQYGGGGSPGRYNAASGARQLFYDSVPVTSATPNPTPVLAALDGDPAGASYSAERSELATNLNCPTTSGDTTCQQLLLYARGYDVGTTAAPASDLSKVTSRSWMMGAVLHSRPVAVSYGARSGYTAANPDVRVLFGSADGLLHMVKNSVGASPSGVESWAMMPKAVMGQIKTQRDNGYSSPGNLGFPYGVDGAVSVLSIDRGKVSGATCPTNPPQADGIIDSTNPCDHAYAYFGLRRGGANYYALDITNPDVPKLMWRIGTDGLYSATYGTPGLVSGSAAWFKELGQTFSTPTVGRMLLQLSSDTTPVSHPVLIFGGGYNGSVNGTKIGKDLNNSRANGTTVSKVGQDDSTGNAIYVVEAVTGELIWKAVKGSTTPPAYAASTLSFAHPLLQDGVPSDVTAVDTDGDGYTDRLYFGDTGGHVWRVDFPLASTTVAGASVSTSDRSKWTLSLLASLGRHASTPGSNTLSNDRRFFEAPDYVPVRDPTTLALYDAVVIASGDREDPFNSTQSAATAGTTNYLYALRDGDTVSGKSLTDATTVDGVVYSESDSRLLLQTSLTALPTCSESAADCSATGITNGWALQLTGYGEKATSAPITTGGVIVFSSFIPPPLVTSASSATCGPTEGNGKLYALTLDYGNFYRPLQFNQDGNGDGRSRSTDSPGLPGEVNAIGTSTLAVNGQTLNVSVTPIVRVYWRERRGDEEKTIPGP